MIITQNMNTLSEIVAAFLTTLFALFSLALLTALLYVLYRKHRIFQQHNTINIPENQHYTPSKELIYFFSWQANQPSRVEPYSSPSPSAPTEDEVAKWQQEMHGACRACETDQVSIKSSNSSIKSKRVSLEDCFEEDVESLSSGNGSATPFSTPCASPPYYTPSPSPTREHSVVDVLEGDGSCVGLRMFI